MTQVLLDIIVHLDPTDVASFSQSCRYAQTFCNPHPILWRSLFLRLFDPPPTSCEDTKAFDYETTLKARIKGRNAVRRAQKHQDPMLLMTRATDLDVFSEMAKMAAHECSPNAVFLLDLFPVDSPFVAQFLSIASTQVLSSRQSGSGTLAPSLEEISVARFQTWYGPTKHSFTSKILGRDLRRIYTMERYTADTNYGTFIDDQLTVDWVSLDAVRNIVLDNIDDARTSEDWGIANSAYEGPLRVPGKRGFHDTLRGGAGPRNGRDWAGVSLNWIGSYSFADWQVFEMINLSPEARIPYSHLRRQGIGELMRLELQLDEDEEAGSTQKDTTSHDDDYPELHFTGTLGTADPSAGPNFPRLAIKGSVRKGKAPDNAIFWSMVVSYGGQGQWQLSCLQVGGERSRQGFCGIWTSALVDGEARGPCGPCMWWPASEA